MKNVLLLHTDQQRYNSLGCTGNPHACTPNIDSLAESGAVFTRHIAANPVCMPSRASLCTGLLPSGHNVWSNGIPLNRNADFGPPEHCRVPGPQHYTRQEPETIADMFANAGYDTAAFGKLHLTPNRAAPEYGFGESWELMDAGKISDWHGPYYGFRYVDITKGHAEQPCQSGHYGDWLAKEYPEIAARAKARQKPDEAYPIPERRDLYASPVPSKLHNSVWLADRFADFVSSRNKETPFFCFVGFPDPHHAFTPPYDLVEMFKDRDVEPAVDPDGKWRQGHPMQEALQDSNGISNLNTEERQIIQRYYQAMVHTIDMGVGKIIQTLKEQGLWDDTIVVFTSDHGDYMCDHALLYKTQVGVDSLLRVPFLLRAPGTDLPDAVDTPMSNCDVAPTLAALCGVNAPSAIDGRNILPFIENNEKHMAFAQSYNGSRQFNNTTLYDSRYRFTWFPGADYVELFDHQEDPGEITNVAADHDDLVHHFQEEIRRRTLESHNPISNRLSSW